MRSAILLALVAFLFAVPRDGRATDKPSCPPLPEEPLRYPAVEPIFVAKCAACHDARKSDNAPAQRVFEMTRYPFATERPDTLLHDLAGMFEKRGNLTVDEKCTGLNWLAGGALDAEGNPPAWHD